MPVRVTGTGPLPADVMLVGERPGHEEVRAYHPMPFIGPSGQELWGRLWDDAQLARSDVYVTNLVKTFSTEPPSKEEIARDRAELMAEILRCKPTLIVTVGYHAARFFLPQFEGVTGDYFHGFPWPYTYGKLTPRDCLVLPIVHPSAALRQPSRYQQQLTDDVRAIRRVMDGALRPFEPVDPDVTPWSLATVTHEASESGILALDTEGSLDRPWTPECISLCAKDNLAALVEFHDIDDRQYPLLRMQRAHHVKYAIEKSDLVCIHHLKHDIKALKAEGIDVPERKWDDTMVMAYILNLPQGLKELMWRLKGWRMKEYDALVRPLDDALVTSTLKAWHDARQSALTDALLALNLAKARNQRRKKQKLAPISLELFEAGVQEAKTRALTSIQKILTVDTADTKRKRWTGSTFASLVTLPPEPTWKSLPQGPRAHYARLDAYAHRVLRDELWSRIEANDLTRAYYLDMGVLPFLVRNERMGLACDGDKLRALAVQFGTDYDQTCRDIEALAGKPVNPMSGDQVSECLFNELGITPTNLTKTRKRHQTGDKYLKARRGEHDIVQLILNARQLKKYETTYAAKLPTLLQDVNDDLYFRLMLGAKEGKTLDQRYFPQWKYTRTATGRLAEEVILLIPKHDPLAKAQRRENRAHAIRNCFHATAGHTLVSVDLSQIELRVMAHLSQDGPLLKAFRRGDDPHALVAHELLGAPKLKKDQDESAHRLPAKTLNFGIINGMTEFGMVDQLHEAGQMQWTKESVRELLDEWFLVHENVKNFWDEQIRLGRDRGYVESMHGRRRPMAALKSTDDRIVKEAERQCLFAIQSSADEISKVWNRRIWKHIIQPAHKQGRYCEPWVRVHDDTTLEVDTKDAKDVAQQMLALVPQLLSIPTTAEAKMGTRWGDLH